MIYDDHQMPNADHQMVNGDNQMKVESIFFKSEWGFHKYGYDHALPMIIDHGLPTIIDHALLMIIDHAMAGV